MDLVCPKCYENALVTEDVEGSTICESCGYVLEENTVRADPQFTELHGDRFVPVGVRVWDTAGVTYSTGMSGKGLPRHLQQVVNATKTSGKVG